MLKKVIGTIWRKLTPSLRLRIVRLTQKQFTVSVAAVIFNENDEVLLLDHVLRPAAPSWGFPGGFLEHREQPVDAVRRELREETGIELTDVELIRLRTSNGHIEILFRAESNDVAAVKSREINAARWFKVSALPENISRKQRELIKNLLKN